jgi:hypothetical protein
MKNFVELSLHPQMKLTEYFKEKITRYFPPNSKILWRLPVPDRSEMDNMDVDTVPAVLDDLASLGLAQSPSREGAGAHHQPSHQPNRAHARQLLLTERINQSRRYLTIKI